MTSRIGRYVVVLSALFAILGWSQRARALAAEVLERTPSLVGAKTKFKIATGDADGNVQYRWDFGDGTRGEFTAHQTEAEHVYTAAGHYSVIVVIKDESDLTSVAFTHTVHHPVTSARSRTSSSIIYDFAHDMVWTVNPDNNSVTRIDPNLLSKSLEVPVYRRPEALALTAEGKLWVVHRDDYAIAVLDPVTGAIERGFRLPYASQPIGLVVSPTQDVAYVTLMAVGKLLELSTRTGEVLREVSVGPWPRGVSVTHDGRTILVTRFISAETQAETVVVDSEHFRVSKVIALGTDVTTVDTDQQGRGIPNYLFSIAISPDGRQAWIPCKKDNVVRGLLRDGQALTQDNTVRPLVSVLDLATHSEVLSSRMDLDDRNLPSHVEFSPLGDYAFVTVTGSNLVEVRDAYKKSFVSALKGAGTAPRSSVLGPQNRLFVHGFLSRNVVVFDVAHIINSSDQTTVKLKEISTVEQELLSPEVLLGKRVFNDSEDKRMTAEGYLSCATCHFDGFEDARVWDFSDRGEGLRNTTSLLGRAGLRHGRVHWSGNFDEIQDFEGAIRNDFGGLGFVPDNLYNAGSHALPLGDPKAGLSPELDALAAYVATLSQVNPSPHRLPDGSLTEDGKAGQELFRQLDCARCHTGPDFTDSASHVVYDVGTLKETSGARLGQKLEGIDTPTLLGIWETAPYLHDGSAATLRDVLTTQNPSDQHARTSGLTPRELDQLIAYLLQIDGDPIPTKLPFENVESPKQTAPRSESGCTIARARKSSSESLMFLVLLSQVCFFRRILPTRLVLSGRPATLRRHFRSAPK